MRKCTTPGLSRLLSLDTGSSHFPPCRAQRGFIAPGSAEVHRDPFVPASSVLCGPSCSCSLATVASFSRCGPAINHHPKTDIRTPSRASRPLSHTPGDTLRWRGHYLLPLIHHRPLRSRSDRSPFRQSALHNQSFKATWSSSKNRITEDSNILILSRSRLGIPSSAWLPNPQPHPLSSPSRFRSLPPFLEQPKQPHPLRNKV